jgi:hypothetical protein
MTPGSRLAMRPAGLAMAGAARAVRFFHGAAQPRINGRATTVMA